MSPELVHRDISALAGIGRDRRVADIDERTPYRRDLGGGQSNSKLLIEGLRKAGAPE